MARCWYEYLITRARACNCAHRGADQRGTAFKFVRVYENAGWGHEEAHCASQMMIGHSQRAIVACDIACSPRRSERWLFAMRLSPRHQLVTHLSVELANAVEYRGDVSDI